MVLRPQVDQEESPWRTHYVGLDVQQARIVIVALNGAGKGVMESIIDFVAGDLDFFSTPIQHGSGRISGRYCFCMKELGGAQRRALPEAELS
jgi:hypothetical protein